MRNVTFHVHIIFFQRQEAVNFGRGVPEIRIYVALLSPCYSKAATGTYLTTRCRNPEDGEINIQLRGNLNN